MSIYTAAESLSIVWNLSLANEAFSLAWNKSCKPRVDTLAACLVPQPFDENERAALLAGVFSNGHSTLLWVRWKSVLNTRRRRRHPNDDGENETLALDRAYEPFTSLILFLFACNAVQERADPVANVGQRRHRVWFEWRFSSRSTHSWRELLSLSA